MLIGDSSLTTDNKNLEIFMNTFNLECSINKPTCFQSKNSPCIDLILTNKKYLLDPFSTNVPLLNALKISENLQFSDVFRGFRSKTLVENGLNNQR